MFAIAMFVGSSLAEDNEFLMVTKIYCVASFGGEVKPWVPCKILWHFKEPYLVCKIFLIKCLVVHCQMCLLVIARQLW
jgi:hypothetical protein